MSGIGDQEFSIECPNQKCGREIDLRIRDATSSRSARCSRCGTQIKFDYSAASNLDRAARDFEKAAQALDKAQEQIMAKAQIQLKG